MCTSAVEKKRLLLTRLACRDLIAAAACALFGAIYEAFSFGVYSNFMLYAFAPLLLLGALPALTSALRSRPFVAAAPCRLVWHAGLVVLTVGCLFKGVLDIYGTTSPLTAVYWIAGAVLLAAAVILQVIAARRAAATR